MGSEAPSPVTIYVTGFRKFHGVAENPTEKLVGNLQRYMKKKGLPQGIILKSCTVLEAAGQGAVSSLYRVLESAVPSRDGEGETSDNSRVILLHLGVNSGAVKFAVETQAFNEATFRCSDELGWKPNKLPVLPADGDISRKRETTLPVNEIVEALMKKGYDVMQSDDPGRFVCNYVYYHSLRFAEEHGIKSLFIHVPLFYIISEKVQMQFVASVLEVLASVL